MTGKYNFAFFDENSKRLIRRAILKAIAIPGYQVPFASREMPIGRGWGTGGLQITLSIITKDDTIKVIDQGSDESVNAVSIKNLIQKTTDVNETVRTENATLIQSRHRIPEKRLQEEQILVLQVPVPEPLRFVEPSEYVTKQLHANAEYTGAWLVIYEEIIRFGGVVTGAGHHVTVHDRYVMTPSPIPKYDNNRLHNSKALVLFGAGREKKIYAVPPYTKVISLAFEDYPFTTEDVSNKKCRLCGAMNVYFDELQDEETGETYYQCNDTSYCIERLNSLGETV